MDKIEDSSEYLGIDESITDYVMSKVDDWQDYYQSNYAGQHAEYYRLFAGIWEEQDSMRASERSRLIAPALSQAVESSAAEIEEATFGRGNWFDIRDDAGDEESVSIDMYKEKLTEDMKTANVRSQISECILTSAIYGTGIGEICLEDVEEIKPAVRSIAEGQLSEIGVVREWRTMVTLKPVLPQNFCIDPLATSIKSSVGVAIDEFVSLDYVERMQEAGIYVSEYVGSAAPDSELEPDDDLDSVWDDHKVRLTRYYGRVPRHMLEAEATAETDEDKMEAGDMVEAIIVIANGGTLLKAEANPYMMRDRPVVAFRWDKAPGRFWGRGVCEKGYMSQKALDTEMRARIDALNMTIHPMIAMDARKMPRGYRPEIAPGKVLLTNGDPRETLHPFNFGTVDQITFTQGASLQAMVQQATGAVDSAGLAGQVNGEATAAGISMSLGATIKRHKRTLTMFQDEFLIPFVQAAAYRYMQFDPERYPVNDYSFSAESSLGIMAREYETTQLTQLLQSMPPQSPTYNIILKAVIDNMAISNRTEIIASIDASSQPDPQQQQKQEQMLQAEQQRVQELHQAQVGLMDAQSKESLADAEKRMAEAKSIPRQDEIDMVKAATANLDDGVQDEREFQRRLQITDRVLQEKKIEMAYKDKQEDRQMRMNQEQQIRQGMAQQMPPQPPMQPPMEPPMQPPMEQDAALIETLMGDEEI
tara:strand:- start:2151 stop:4259 length:2109 start_codon:yes stop_codon:yes gene_type:complete